MRFVLSMVLAALACVAPGPRPRREAAEAFDPPRLSIQPGGRVDLGQLGPLEPKVQRYTITNTSAAPITLRVFDLSPGITVAGPALDRSIPPRSSAGLELRVDPSGRVGPQAGNVRLGTDDPRQGRYYLPVRLAVRPDLTVDGTRRSFGDVGVLESPLAQFTFVRETGRPLQLRLPDPLPPCLECELRTAGPRGSLAFVLRPGRAGPGASMGLERIRVETNAPLQPRFDLYLEWRIHHPIEAEPRRAVFTAPGETLELRLKSRDGAPFRILGAELRGEGFRLGSLPVQAAPEQILAIRLTAAAPARALLALRCSGQEELLEIPVAYVSPAPAGDEGVIVVPPMDD